MPLGACFEATVVGCPRENIKCFPRTLWLMFVYLIPFCCGSVTPRPNPKLCSQTEVYKREVLATKSCEMLLCTVT